MPWLPNCWDALPKKLAPPGGVYRANYNGQKMVTLAESCRQLPHLRQALPSRGRFAAAKMTAPLDKKIGTGKAWLHGLWHPNRRSNCRYEDRKDPCRQDGRRPLCSDAPSIQARVRGQVVGGISFGEGYAFDGRFKVCRWHLPERQFRQTQTDAHHRSPEVKVIAVEQEEAHSPGAIGIGEPPTSARARDRQCRLRRHRRPHPRSAPHSRQDHSRPRRTGG